MVALPEQPWWYTADEIVQVTADGLRESIGQATRWLTEGAAFLHWAYLYDDLDRCLIEPTLSIDQRWDTLIAATIRYRLRVLDVPAPEWTYKPPLEQMWFLYDITPRMAISTIHLTPPELRRVGIFIRDSAFGFPTRADLVTNGVLDAFHAATRT